MCSKEKPSFIDRLIRELLKREFYVGEQVKFTNGVYYYDSYGGKPYGFRNRNKPVYITKINMKGTHPYHISVGSKLGNGDLGWIKAEQIMKVGEHGKEQ